MQRGVQQFLRQNIFLEKAEELCVMQEQDKAGLQPPTQRSQDVHPNLG